MLRWTSAALLAAVTSGFALLLVTGKYYKEGPVLTTLSWNHGIHRGDLFVLAGWAVAMLSIGQLVRAPHPARTGASADAP